MLANALLGSQFDPTVEARVTITFFGDNPTNARTQLEIVANSGTAFERRSDASNNVDGRRQVFRIMSTAKLFVSPGVSAPAVPKQG
ncbi:MAG: hypothetical protein AAGI12_15765 [Pseudomonadota bacterium]